MKVFLLALDKKRFQVSFKNALGLRLKLAAIAAFMFTTGLLAQQQPQVSSPKINTPVDNLVPPSPEAAALGKYAAIPVGLYTGIPQINIPICEVKEGDITVPVSLSYHASIKPDEIASRVGLGWTLNAGGVISRTIVGKPDECGIPGFLNYSHSRTPAQTDNPAEDDRFALWYNLTLCVDAEPDQFVFNFNGNTGKFSFEWNTDGDNSILVSSDSKVKIEPIGLPAPASNGFIQGWKVTDDHGFIYLFEAREQTVYRSGPPPATTCDCNGIPITSWYLTQIASPNGAKVNFSYEPYSLSYRVWSGENTEHMEEGQQSIALPTYREYGEMNVAWGLNLSQISTSSGNSQVDFIQSAPNDIRTDVPLNLSSNENQLRRLAEITLKTRSGGDLALVKDMRLGYNYETGETVTNADGSLKGGRLTLKTIQEMPVDGSPATKPPYRFTYNTAVKLPSFRDNNFLTDDRDVGTVKQDHWGFYNSNPHPTMLAPTYRVTYQNQEYVYEGADRSPDAEKMKAGILTQIQYPTGGTTTFDYEPHEYGAIGKEELGSVSRMAGGLRIKQITDYDGINIANNIIRKFEYKINSPQYGLISSGVLSQKPLYEHHIVRMIQVPDGLGGNRLAQFLYIDRVATSVVIAGLTQGSPIGYRQVDVLYGANGEGGKSTSYFTSFYDHNDDYLLDNQGTETQDDDYYHCLIQPYPAPSSTDYARGLLTREVQYKYENRNYIPIQQIDNIYETKEASVPGYKVGFLYTGAGYNDLKPYVNVCFAKAWHYNQFGISRLVHSTETRFENGQSYVTEKGYTYNKTQPYDFNWEYRFLQSDTTTTSTNKRLINLYSYAFNYSGPAGDPQSAIPQMKDRHILAPAIEKINIEQDASGNQKVIGASYTDFSLFNNKVLVKKQWQLAVTAPLSLSDFHPSQYYFGLLDPHYAAVFTMDNYTDIGMPQQMTSRGGNTSSYLWGYYGSLPIAQIANAPFSQCAFTSFESRLSGLAAEGNWEFEEGIPVYVADAKTGRYSMKGTVYSQSLPDGKYIVSMWAKGSGTVTVNNTAKTITADWNRYEWLLTNPLRVTVSSNGNLVDELRLYPEGAQMKTFTYKPGVGLSSTTDANHRTGYYEYDMLGRLKNIKDQYGNILKNYQYHYKGY